MDKFLKIFSKYPYWFYIGYIGGMFAGLLYEPFSLITLLWLLWYCRTQVWNNIQKGGLRIQSFLEKDHPILAWMPLILILIGIIFSKGIMPQDDFPRHATSYLHNFDYRNYYLYENVLSSISATPWFGFEWLVGHFHHFILSVVSIFLPFKSELNKNGIALFIVYHGVVSIALAIFGWIFIPIFRYLYRRHSMRHALVGCIIGLFLLAGLGCRCFLARPEVFLMLAMFAAWRLPPRIWVIVMIMLQPFYWLAFIYSIGAFLINSWSIRKRCFAIAVICASYLIFWHQYAGINFIFHFYDVVSNALKTRVLNVSENTSFIYYMFSIIGLLIIVFWIISCRIAKQGIRQASDNYNLILVIVFWISLNQIRYVVCIVPCLAYLCAKCYELYGVDSECVSVQRRTVKSANIIISFMAAQTLLFNADFFRGVPMFSSLPAQAQVLTFFNSSSFLMPALYPTIKTAPPMEVGFATLDFQKFLKDLYETRGESFNCADLKKRFPRFTHIVEEVAKPRLPFIVPACLKMQERTDTWILWKIL